MVNEVNIIKILEGFGYTAGFTKDDFENVDGEHVEFIRKNGKFIFSSTDNPTDFIHIEPVMHAKKLNIKPKDESSLSTFEGAQILYGFTAVQPYEFRDLNMQYKSSGPRLQNIYQEIEELGWPSSSRKIEINSAEALARFINDWKIELPRLQRDMDEQLEGHVQTLQHAVEMLKGMREAGAKTIRGYIKDAMVKDNQNRSRNSKYLGYLQYAFAKAVKNPTTDEELEVAANFMQLAIDVLISKGYSDYDMILYPMSGSSFNRDFAETIAQKVGGLAMMIPKVPADKVQVNKSELLRRAAMVNKRKIDGMDRTLTDEEWAEHEERKLKAKVRRAADGNVSIKNIYGDKRRYLQIFDFQDQELIKDTSVLIIDDNVAHQGTMEMLHSLVSLGNPRKLDLYAPLLLQNYW